MMSAKPDDAGVELKILVAQLIKEANELLSPVIEKTRLSDNRSKLQRADWPKRHRLQVLLDTAQRAETSLPESVVNPWFLTELKAILEIVRRWHDKPIWKEIEPSLVEPTHFTHTIAKLYIAEHFQSAGHEVRIVPRGTEASPDLSVQAIGGTQDWISVECYQPKPLSGASVISHKKIEKIVDKSMEKAKRQLGEKASGILMICGFNQSTPTQDDLKQTIAKRLQKTQRPNLCVVGTLFQGIKYSETAENRSFQTIISVDFVPNPSYFGRVDFDSSVPKEDPRLIREALIDVTFQDIISKRLGQLPRKDDAKDRVAQIFVARPREEKLKIIRKPDPLSRAVVYSKGAVLLFRGEGDINYLCGQCGSTLVERGWKLSLSNIVVECPLCHSYNEFPKLERSSLPIKGPIGVAHGDYPFTDVVTLKRGVCIEGM